MKDAIRAILYLIAAEMERQGVKRVEDLKLTKTDNEPTKVDLCKLRKLIDREPDKLVVPQCISAPGYESGLAAKQTEQQQNCPYCHEGKALTEHSDDFYSRDAEGVFIVGNDIVGQSESGYVRFRGKIPFCPFCRRPLDKQEQTPKKEYKKTGIKCKGLSCEYFDEVDFGDAGHSSHCEKYNLWWGIDDEEPDCQDDNGLKAIECVHHHQCAICEHQDVCKDSDLNREA